MKNKFPAISSIIASILAVIGASCCVIPLIFLNLGIGGAWLANLAILQPARPYLIAASIIALAASIYLFWRGRKSDCGSCEDAPKRNTGTVILILISVLLIGAALIWPQIEPDLVRMLR